MTKRGFTLGLDHTCYFTRGRLTAQRLSCPGWMISRWDFFTGFNVSSVDAASFTRTTSKRLIENFCRNSRPSSLRIS